MNSNRIMKQTEGKWLTFSIYPLIHEITNFPFTFGRGDILCEMRFYVPNIDE